MLPVLPSGFDAALASAAADGGGVRFGVGGREEAESAVAATVGELALLRRESRSPDLVSRDRRVSGLLQWGQTAI